jgi:hypothetical protein
MHGCAVPAPSATTLRALGNGDDMQGCACDASHANCRRASCLWRKFVCTNHHDNNNNDDDDNDVGSQQ